jgi:hypothetical protein
MSSSLAEVYIMVKTSLMDKFKHKWKKNDMASNMVTLFDSGALWRSSFLGNLKPSDQKNMVSKELQLEPIIIRTSCPPYQPLPQITLSWAEILDRPMYFFTVA